MKALLKIIFPLIVHFTVSKDIKDKERLSLNGMLNLSSVYDYHIYYDIYKDYLLSDIYFFIATEMNIIPFDITYSFRGANDSSKNISIYHEEQKGKLKAFFFKLEKPKDNISS